MIPSPFPIVDLQTESLKDGLEVPSSSFCKTAMIARPECVNHYRHLATQKEGYYECPFGFTSRSFFFETRMHIITGVIAFPRFNTGQERERAKRFPGNKCTRASVDGVVNFLREVETLRADAIAESAKVLPQAFHELRKLNGAVLQHAEREITEIGERRGLLSIRSAAELMRNNFDILEALSNIEGMRALPSDSTINVFDLAFKMKRVLQEKGSNRGISISVNGVRAIIRGSQKSFPIVPAVLLENAIKYGTANRPVRVDVATKPGTAVLTVENHSDTYIDVNHCFDRGARYAAQVEGAGFGLFLAKEIVLSHNGSIRCENTDSLVKMIVELPLVTVIE